MKFCLSGRQSRNVLSKADEIKMRYNDQDRMLDYMEDYPNKTFILEIPKGIKADEIKWDTWAAYAEATDLIFGLRDLTLVDKCKEHNIKFYYDIPIFTWYELNGIIKLNPCYLYISDSLYFSLKKIKQKTNIPIRLCANLAYDPYIPREDGICGTWIRPEDVDTYAEWVDTLQFYFESLSQEATLFKVYAEDKAWPGNLNLLLTNFNYNVDNRVIPEELGKQRANCGRRCMESSSCHLCDSALRFATAIRNEFYKDKMKAYA